MLETAPYIHKPDPVTAVKVTVENMEEVADWCGGGAYPKNAVPFIAVPALVEFRSAFVGDYVLRNELTGKFYPLSAETFERRFDKVEVKETVTCRCGKPHPPGARGVH